MRDFQEDPLDWITGAILALILLGFIICSLCLVGKLEQRETPKDQRSQKLAQMPTRKLRTNTPELPPAQPKTVWIYTVDQGWIEELYWGDNI
jgi:hypothetical protein